MRRPFKNTRGDWRGVAGEVVIYVGFIGVFFWALICTGCAGAQDAAALSAAQSEAQMARLDRMDATVDALARQIPNHPAIAQLQTEMEAARAAQFEQTLQATRASARLDQLSEIAQVIPDQVGAMAERVTGLGFVVEGLAAPSVDRPAVYQPPATPYAGQQWGQMPSGSPYAIPTAQPTNYYSAPPVFAQVPASQQSPSVQAPPASTSVVVEGGGGGDAPATPWWAYALGATTLAGAVGSGLTAARKPVLPGQMPPAPMAPPGV